MFANFLKQYHKKCVENTKENMHIDIGALKGKKEAISLHQRKKASAKQETRTLVHTIHTFHFFTF